MDWPIANNQQSMIHNQSEGGLAMAGETYILPSQRNAEESAVPRTAGSYKTKPISKAEIAASLRSSQRHDQAGGPSCKTKPICGRVGHGGLLCETNPIPGEAINAADGDCAKQSQLAGR